MNTVVIQALKQKDPFDSLVKLLNNENSEIKEEAAKKLYKLGGNRSVKYLLQQAQEVKDMSVFLELASLCECSGYEMELLRIGLECGDDGKDCVLYALNNIEAIKYSEKKTITAAIRLKQVLFKSDNVVNIKNIQFLNEALDVIENIEVKESAKIFNFVKKG